MSYNSPKKIRTVSKTASGFLSARVSPFIGCGILPDPSRSFQILLLPHVPYPSVNTSHHVLLSGKLHTFLCSEGQDLFLSPDSSEASGGNTEAQSLVGVPEHGKDESVMAGLPCTVCPLWAPSPDCWTLRTLTCRLLGAPRGASSHCQVL